MAKGGYQLFLACAEVGEHHTEHGRCGSGSEGRTHDAATEFWGGAGELECARDPRLGYVARYVPGRVKVYPDSDTVQAFGSVRS